MNKLSTITREVAWLATFIIAMAGMLLLAGLVTWAIQVTLIPALS
ncbi:MAG: hypothetical protein AAB922_06120 [Patescibacteria group bacterium]